ncbi:rhodanese-like domain-containing protein [Bacteroidota bacterium]
MKIPIKLFVLAAMLQILFTACGQNEAVVQLNSNDFIKKIYDDKAILLDVRTLQEYKNGHIKDAGQLNYYAFDFSQSLLLLAKDQPIYLYCNTGYRSNKAANILLANGYTKVYNLQRGIMEWNMKNLPVIIDVDAKPDFDNKFDGLTIGEQILEDPRINLIFYNSIGTPLNIYFPFFKAINGTDSVILSGPGLQSLNVDYPSIYNVGETVISKITLDKSNSNVKDVFDISPEKITYEVEGKSNPTGTVIQNFVLDTSNFYMDVEVEIPLFGRAWNFTMQDTNDFDFDNDIGDVDEIQYIEVALYAVNELPAEGLIQVYFTDSNYVVIDSLYKSKEQIIKSAIPGPPPTYRVIQKTDNTTSVILDRPKMDKIKTAEKIITSIEFSTVNNGGTIVKFYSDYTVDLKIGVNVRLKTEF